MAGRDGRPGTESRYAAATELRHLTLLTALLPGMQHSSTASTVLGDGHLEKGRVPLADLSNHGKKVNYLSYTRHEMTLLP